MILKINIGSMFNQNFHNFLKTFPSSSVKSGLSLPPQEEEEEEEKKNKKKQKKRKISPPSLQHTNQDPHNLQQRNNKKRKKEKRENLFFGLEIDIQFLIFFFKKKIFDKFYIPMLNSIKKILVFF